MYYDVPIPFINRLDQKFHPKCVRCRALIYENISLAHSCHSVEEYERSWEQNEELSLNDMDTSSADAAYGSADVESSKDG